MRTFDILSACRAAIVLAAAAFAVSCGTKTPTEQFIQSKFDQYADSSKVNQLVFVCWYNHESDAEIMMYERDGRKWKETLACPGFIGRNGLSANRHAGDKTTPIGDFGIVESFGLKENPGTSLPYFVVEDHHWCCGDSVAYNRIIDIRDCPHHCEGEHLIDYDPAYNYSIFFDFNKECVLGKGSAIFFHCYSSRRYTSGCVAVSEDDMKKIMMSVDMGARIIIQDFPALSY